MRRTFNLGVGLVIAVSPDDAAAVCAAVEAAGDRAFVLGRVVAAPGAEGEARVRYSS